MKISSSEAKVYGELAELRFLLKCRELGLLVSKPVSELGRCDFLVDTGLKPRRPPLRRRPKTDGRRPLRGRLPAANCWLPILRVQVKSTAYQQPLRTRRNPKNLNGTRITVSRGAWRINLTCQSGHVPYRRHDFDILAAYVFPLDCWYLIPAHLLPRRQQILLSPDGLPRYRRWEQFRKRWDLLFSSS